MGAELTKIISGIDLLVLPGAWVAFGLRLRPLSFAGRLALAGVLSPVVIAVEFFLLRLVGFSFVTTAWALLLVNAGSVCLLVLRRGELRAPLTSLAYFALTYVLLAGCVAIPWLHSREIRIFTGHPLMQMSILYQFPGGALIPEEPELAGVRLIYPWLGHIYWSVLGWVANLAPTRMYVVTNLVWLFWVCVLFYEACRILGASRFASRIALLWLGLGTNVAGSLIWSAAGTFFGRAIRFPGDIRFTPWVRQFIVFELMPFALGLFAAMVLAALVLLRSRERPWLVMIAVLLAGIGLIYPVLFPPALGFCSVLLLLVWLDERSKPLTVRQRSSVLLCAGIVVASLIALANVHFILAGRSSPAIFFSGGRPLLGKLKGALIALCPFLFASLLLERRQLVEKKTVLLLVGSFPSLLLLIYLRVSGGYNEYKFLFCTALSMSPILALAVDRWVPKRVSPTLAALVSVLLIIPDLPAIYVQQGLYGFPFFPQVRERGFFLQLSPAEPEARWIEAIRAGTPADTVVVLRRCNLFVPGIVGRSLWAPPEQPHPAPGYWADSRFTLVKERGYPPSLVDSREAVLQSVFECTESCSLPGLESRLTSLGRPVAIIFAPGEGRDFLVWLQRQHLGRMLDRGPRGTIVWLIEPESGAPAVGQPGKYFGR